MRRCCGNCESFDGGGVNRVVRAMESGTPIEGDCLNNRAPRFQMKSDESCRFFLPDSIRFPEENARAAGALT